MRLRVYFLLLLEVSLHTAVSSMIKCGRPPLPSGVDGEVLQRVYEPGEDAVLSCAPGYLHAGGSRVIVCSNTGEWSTITFKCAPKSCPPPDDIAHGKAEFSDIVFTSTINYTCDEGYVLNGMNTSSCMHDGKWSHPPPVCESVTCGLPPIPNYSQIIFDKKPVGNIFEFGFGGRYECGPHLVMFGDERAYCQANGRWTEPPECRPVVCPAPTEIPNGFITLGVRREHSYKERVKYGCNMNYIMDGISEVVCEKTGQWSAKPVCRAPCTVNIKRGELFYKGQFIWIEDFKPNRVLHSEHVVFDCLNKEKGKYYVAERCVDGTLKIPECFKEPSVANYRMRYGSVPSEIDMSTDKAVVCPAPTEIPNGFITLGVRREHSYKERVKYGCNMNYIMDGISEVVCEKTGQWSAKPVCRAPCTVNIKRGELFYKGQFIWIEDFKPNRVLHSEYVVFDCLNEEKGKYYVAERCVDGTLKIPECFKEPSLTNYRMRYGSVPSEIDMSTDKAVVCPAPTEIPNGFITLGVRREHSYKERVKYGCNMNYIMDGISEVECEKTGQWSAKPVCGAPCTVNIKRGKFFYKGQFIWIEDFKPNRVLHSEYVVFDCLNEEKGKYYVAERCVDGTLKIPECFKEPSVANYRMRYGSVPSEIDMSTDKGMLTV